MTKVAPPVVLADGNKALASGEETAAAVMPKVSIVHNRPSITYSTSIEIYFSDWPDMADIIINQPD